MTSLAIILVITAAIFHATWNYMSKKACGGVPFIWLFSVLSSVLYFPLAVWTFLTSNIAYSWTQLGFIATSAVLHTAYFHLLNKGYQFGDLSVIYPLARGSGPLLSTLVAVLFLGEQPTLLAIGGTLCIGVGILIITGNPFKQKTALKSVLFALCCGTAIAAYTITDKIAVSRLLMPPLLLDWCTNLGRAAVVTPYAVTHWDEVKKLWASNKREVWAVAILSPLAYILVLTAMMHNPVSYIAPAREISILFGTVLGSTLLAEGNLKLRLTGASAMLTGLVCLSIG